MQLRQIRIVNSARYAICFIVCSKFNGEKEFTKWISHTLGSLLRQPVACKVLKRELEKANTSHERFQNS